MDMETAIARPRSPVSCVVEARGLQVVQDKPAEFGGTNEGMMASEHLLVALLSCQLSTFAKVAAKRGANVTPQSVQGDLHFNDAGDIEKIVVTWLLAGDAAGQDTLVRLTDKVCTISRALSVPVETVIQ